MRRKTLIAAWGLIMAIFMLIFNEIAIAESTEPLTENEWMCPNCKSIASGNYCSNCGAPQPTPTPAVEPTLALTPAEWLCANCNSTATGNFCSNCGTQRTDATLTTDQNPSPVESKERIGNRTAHLEAGRYTGGDDIPAGKYILSANTEGKGSGIVWLAKDTDNLDEEYPSLLYEFLGKKEEKRFYVNIREGYILSCPFPCNITLCDQIEFDKGEAKIEAGRYTFGDDISAGKYIVLCEPGSKESGIVWIATNTDNLSENYPSVLYEFIGKKESRKYYFNASEGFILCCPFSCTLIKCSTLEFTNDSVDIEAGKYTFGDDLPAGKYTLTCNIGGNGSGIVWIASDTDDLSQNYPSLLYEFIGRSSVKKYSINVKEGFILNCPFPCTLTKSKGINFD